MSEEEYDNDRYIELAKEKLNSSKKNWFKRSDLDEHLYGIAGKSLFDGPDIESDEPYLNLFPQNLLDVIETCIHCDPSLERINASNVLKGLKEAGYMITKIK